MGLFGGAIALAWSTFPPLELPQAWSGGGQGPTVSTLPPSLHPAQPGTEKRFLGIWEQRGGREEVLHLQYGSLVTKCRILTPCTRPQGPSNLHAPTPISMLQAKTSRFPAALGPLSLTCRLCSCFHLSGTFSFTLANQSSTTQPSTPCTRTPSLPHWAPEQPLPTPCFWEQSPAASWAFLWAKFRIYLCRGRRSFLYTTFSDWFFCNSVICGVEGGCTHMLTRESFAEQVTSSS